MTFHAFSPFPFTAKKKHTKETYQYIQNTSKTYANHTKYVPKVEVCPKKMYFLYKKTTSRRNNCQFLMGIGLLDVQSTYWGCPRISNLTVVSPHPRSPHVSVTAHSGCECVEWVCGVGGCGCKCEGGCEGRWGASGCGCWCKWWVWVVWVDVVCGRSLVGSVGLDDKNTKSNHPTPTQSRGKGDYGYPSFNNQEAPVA